METIAHEKVEQAILYASMPLRLGLLMLVDICPERLLKARLETLKVSSLFQELEHGWFEAREGKELFYAHLKLGCSITINDSVQMCLDVITVGNAVVVGSVLIQNELSANAGKLAEWKIKSLNSN